MRLFSYFKAFWAAIFEITTKPAPLEDEVWAYLHEQAFRLFIEEWTTIVIDINAHLLSKYYIPRLCVTISHPTVHPVGGGKYLDKSRILISVEALNISVTYSHSCT